jgi:hypothetical protein
MLGLVRIFPIAAGVSLRLGIGAVKIARFAPITGGTNQIIGRI